MFKILSYPPTLEQLTVLQFFGFNNGIGLWIVRLLSLLAIVTSLWLWWKLIKLYFGKETAKWSTLVMVVSPTLFVLGLCFPLYCIKVLLVLGAIWLLQRKSYFLLVLLPLIIGFNLFVLGNKPAVFNKLSLVDAQTEVNNRFAAEDSLRTKITMPLWWRRISYNKYFFAYKQVAAEVVPFFDLESLFFQEINPLEQKSVVMFYWPEVFLLILGIYGLRNNISKHKLLILAIVAIFNYVFSEGSVYLRLSLAMLPLSVVVASGIVILKERRAIFYGIILVLMYSVGVNWADLNLRTNYWLDNRPLAFQFWYQNMTQLDLDKYDQITVTTIVGDSRVYCKYYLGNKCDSNKFVFKGFELTSDTVIKSGLYAGFAGEFVGSRYKNDIANNWMDMAQSIGLSEIAHLNLRDTIAYKYGNDIGLMIKK